MLHLFWCYVCITVILRGWDVRTKQTISQRWFFWIPTSSNKYGWDLRILRKQTNPEMLYLFWCYICITEILRGWDVWKSNKPSLRDGCFEFLHHTIWLRCWERKKQIINALLFLVLYLYHCEIVLCVELKQTISEQTISQRWFIWISKSYNLFEIWEMPHLFWCYVCITGILRGWDVWNVAAINIETTYYYLVPRNVYTYL